jgi:molybdate transport system substrate-binding protein
MLKTVLLAAALAVAALPANAAELHFLVGGSMQEPFKEIGAAYTKKTGNTIDFTVDTTGALVNKLKSGAPADLILVSEPAMDSLLKDNKVVAGSRVSLARAAIGVSVKAGAALPDLSSEEAFKKAILAAKSVSYVNPEAGGTSGTYMDGLFKKMGIGDSVRAKVVWGYQGSQVADAVATGKAEIGITFISEMAPNKGVKIAGPLPASIQNATAYDAAIPNGAKNADAARAFLAMMTGPEGKAAIAHSNLEPIAH